MKFILLALLFANVSDALPRVATVTDSDFQVGKKWHWNYYDSKYRNYSTEQYEVISNDNGKILIEMSSHFPGEQIFKPHHRIAVALEDCLRSYSNPVEKQPWSMRMFYLDQGKWKETEPPGPLAFEEKFNCNPYRHDSFEFLTVFDESPLGEIFSQRRWRKLESSWFLNSGENAGIVFKKDFPHGAGGETYHMQIEQTPPKFLEWALN